VANDQPVRAGHLHSTGEGLLDGGKKTKQDESYQNREQRQRCAQLFAIQIAPDEVEEFHSGFVAESWPLSK